MSSGRDPARLMALLGRTAFDKPLEAQSLEPVEFLAGADEPTRRDRRTMLSPAGSCVFVEKMF